MNGMVDVAKNRGIVRLADGRTGHLIYWPIAPEKRDPATGRRPRGGQAVVQIPGGSYINVMVDEIVKVESPAA